ncbi:MAG: SMC-Scp complex subunit ScpB [Pirellulales bacterium]
MTRTKKTDPALQPTEAGFKDAPADGGLSIDKLAQAFAAMMGTAGPTDAGHSPATDVVEVDVSPDLDAAEDEAACRVSPLTILEAILFVGLPGGKPISSREVSRLMRGVRPQELDDLAVELGQRYRADNCPYDVVSQEGGWVMRLRPEFARFGSVLEARARMVRLDADALDVLATVAWNQPVPRDKLVELGCDAGPAVIRQLVRRGLLEVRTAEGGEPSYATTPRFLEVFKIESLADLPSPTEPPQ